MSAITRDEFIERFVARMMALTGGFDGNGEPIADYARDTAEAAYDDEWQREEGPEACVDTDMSYWEPFA